MEVNMIPTWALVVSIVLCFTACSFILGIVIKKWINNLYDGWAKYEKLKEEVIVDWRNTYCKKLDGVKDAVDTIKEDMKDKVALVEHKEVKMQVDSQGKKILVLEIEVGNLLKRRL